MRGILIIAKQRSGTNFLRSLLSSAGPVANWGEVFQPVNLSEGSRYDSWSTRNRVAAPVTYKDAVRHSEEFLSFFEGRERAPCIDVKYNSLLCTVGTWYSAYDPPPILVAALNKRFLIIHLERANRLEYAISTLVARNSGQYVAKLGDHVDDRRIAVSPEAVSNIAKQYDYEVELVEHWLGRAVRSRPGACVVRLTYEDLSKAAPDELERQIGGILTTCGIPRVGTISADTKKIIRDWRQIVLNPEPVEREFTNYAKLRAGRSTRSG